MINSDYIQILASSFPFWDKLSQAQRQNVLHSTQSVQFKKGNTVHDGNDCTGVMLIKSGSLRIYMISEDGKEITLYRLFSGDICMLSASCVLDAVTFDVFVDAEENSECVIIGGCAFAELSEQCPEAKIFALECAVRRFSDVMWVMQQILFMSMDKRLAIFLLDEISKTNSDTVKYTHEQIAKYIGSAREVVSRTLKYFSNEGILESSRSGIKIFDKARLRALTV